MAHWKGYASKIKGTDRQKAHAYSSTQHLASATLLSSDLPKRQRSEAKLVTQVSLCLIAVCFSPFRTALTVCTLPPSCFPLFLLLLPVFVIFCVNRWLCGWSDLWIKSSASSSSSSWSPGPCSWVCSSQLWYRFSFFWFTLCCWHWHYSRFQKLTTSFCFCRFIMKVFKSSRWPVTSSMRPCQTIPNGLSMSIYSIFFIWKCFFTWVYNFLPTQRLFLSFSVLI